MDISIKYAFKLIRLKKAKFLYGGSCTSGRDYIAIKRFNKIYFAYLAVE
jgi:hypothetical protein